MPTSRFCLSDLSNQLLVERLKKLVERSNEVLSEILAHLVEVDVRKLYLEQGFSSLFTYAIGALGFSESSAYKRIHAARAAHRFPIIFEMIERGEIHLSAVTWVAPHLSDENHHELLAAVAHKSKRAVEEILAARFPLPDAKTLLRTLPISQNHATTIVASTPISQVTCPHAGNATPSDPMTSMNVLMPKKTTQSEPSPDMFCNKRPPISTLTPLSPKRYRLQVTLSEVGRDALVRAKELLGTNASSDDFATICEIALTKLCEQLEKKKFAKSNSPQRRLENVETQSHSRYIPAHIRRAVSERDGYQCSFVAANGHRCNERKHLQFHHDEPFAHGGKTSVENLKLTCAMHNRYHAVLDFGDSWMKQFTS